MKNPNIVYIKPRTPELGDYHVKKNKACCSDGPYVDLNWFLKMVEQKLENEESDGCDYCYKDAVRLLAKKIKKNEDLSEFIPNPTNEELLEYALSLQ